MRGGIQPHGVNPSFFCLFFCSCLLQLLISKLEKNKAVKAEDKAKIMETLGMLTKSITKLQEEIKGISSSNNPLRTAKSKAQVVLSPNSNHTCNVDLVSGR